MSDDEQPAAKRLKIGPHTSSSMSSSIQNTAVEVCADGDAIIVVKDLPAASKRTSIRVSSHVLSISSSVFKRLLTNTPSSADALKTVELPDDDGEMIRLLCLALHLRNEQLPSRLSPDTLLRFIAAMSKYDCVVALSRSVSPWFDQIYNNDQDAPLIPLVEAACTLDDAFYFARFSSKWILQQPLNLKTHELPSPEPHQERLIRALIARQKEAVAHLRQELDIIVDECAAALGDDAQHYIDCAPGAERHPDELVPGADQAQANVRCVVDREGALLYLSALRDADLWPSNRWSGQQIELIVRRFAEFRIPAYDASDECYWCIHVEDRFANAFALVRRMHHNRLWGLCLDCYRTPKGLNSADCRYDHAKPLHLTSISRAMSATGSSGQAGAPAGGPASVPTMGPMIGPSLNQLVGPGRGPTLNQLMGPVRRPAGGQATGPVTGQAIGLASGQVIGPTRGQAISPASGQVAGPGRSQAIGTANGQANGLANGQSSGRSG